MSFQKRGLANILTSAVFRKNKIFKRNMCPFADKSGQQKLLKKKNPKSIKSFINKFFVTVLSPYQQTEKLITPIL